MEEVFDTEYKKELTVETAYQLQNVSLSDVTHLRVYYIANPQFPSYFSSLNRLKNLHVWKCELDKVPLEICQLSNLEILHITCTTHLKVLPLEIVNLVNLKELHLDHNQISDISMLPQLPNLEFLTMFGNQVEELPKGFIKLKYLSMLMNKIKNVQSLIYSVDLTYINFYGNQIEDITPICFLVNLEKITLNENQIKELPKEIGNLVKLEEMSLCDNQIATIPEEMVKLVSLKKLWINKNQIVNADILFQITSLELLCIGGNQIEFIPETLEKMDKLEFFSLSGNMIKVITRGMLQKIRHNVYGNIGIDISGNQISDMIPVINYLEKEHNQEEDKLSWISLSNNLIEQIPVEIMKFKGIQFSLKENKIKELSKELSQGLQDMIEKKMLFI